jgi:hypothetical protein
MYTKPKPVRAYLFTAGACLLCCIFASDIVIAQNRAVTIAVNDYRPVAAAISQLEQLSAIPINFEDVRSDFPGDQLDVTAQNVTPAQQQLALQGGRGPVKDIAPRGGLCQPQLPWMPLQGSSRTQMPWRRH